MNPSSLSSRQPMPTQPQFVMALAIGLMAMVFWIDLQVPLGVAGGVPYVAVVLLTLWLPFLNATVVFAVVCSGFTLVGYWWSPPGGEMWQVVTNRSLALFAIWTTALLLLQYKKYRLQVEAEGLAFRTMMDLMPHMVFARNGEGNIIAMNEASRVFMEHNGTASSGTRFGLYATQEEEVQARDYEALLFHQSASRHQRKETFVDAQGLRRVYEVSRFPFVWPDTGEKVLCAVAVDETQRQTELEGLRLMEQVVDTSLDHIAVISPDYRYRRVNAAFQRAHGVEGLNLHGLHVKDLRGEETFSRILRPQLDRCLAGDTFTHENWVSLGARGKRYMSVCFFPLRQAGKGVDGVVTVSRDLTDHKNTELENQTLREAFEQAMEGMALHNIQGDCTYVNPAQAAVYGYGVEELVGKSWRVLYAADQIQYIEKQCLPLFEKEGQWRGELIGKRKNGESVDVEVSLRQLRNEGGIPAGWLCTCRDITERKLAEGALHNSEYRYRSVVETAGCMIVGLDLEGKITDWNREAARLYGQPREEVLGKKYVELFFHDQDRSAVEADIEKVLSGVPTRDFENSIRLQSGVFRTMAWNVDRLVDANKSPIGLIAIGRDITDSTHLDQAYSELVNSIEGIVWECEFPSYRFTFVSQQAERLLGYSRTQWLEEPEFFSLRLHPEDREWALSYCLQETMANRAHELEYRMVGADGRVIWLRDFVNVVVEHDQPVKVRGVMVDVTERKRAEDALEKSRKRFQAIFESAGIGMVIVNAKGNLVESNPSFQRFLGYSSPELQKMTFMDFTHEEDLPLNLSYFQELKAGTRNAYSMHKRYLRSDRQIVWGKLTVTPIRESHGEFAYAIAMIEDITERKKSEAALHASESTLKSFFDSSPLMMGIVELMGDDIRHLSDNPAAGKFFEVDPILMKHQCAKDLGVPKEYVDLWVSQYRKSEQTHQPTRFEYQHQRSDGMRWLSATVTAIVSEETGNPRFAYIVEDITDRRRLEEDIHQHNEELEAEVERRALRIQELEQRRMQVEKLAALAQVAAGVAHEINNPLASISQSLEVLKRAIPVTHPRYKYIGKIHDSVDRMAHIVRQLYQLYRPDTKFLEPVSLHEILNMTVEIMKDAAKRQGVILVATIPEQLPAAKVSRNNVTQILCNIIQNALDVTQRNGIVEIGVEEQTDAVVVWVADHGPGISDEVAPHIFEPFFTTKDGTSTQGGMGMGLAVSYRLMESCGGSINFSTKLSQGTTFRITIPLDKKVW